MPSLVQPLFDGPLDIVGDVHGEIEALRSVLGHLGYTEDGHHLQSRRIVFIGDLTDRGPDSPAVINLVAKLIDSGRAQCVLGNHDLNILLKHPRDENEWFYGKAFFDGDVIVPQVLADNAIRQEVRALFRKLPIALVRDDLRIVHACWNDAMIGIARGATDVVGLYKQQRQLIQSTFADLELDIIDQKLERQNKNPVKLLTSGPEERTDEPIETGGKIRYERRVEWWNDYRGVFCVFGHYSIPDGRDRGNASAFCVDYGVGKRWMERREGKSSGFSFKLAALRFPERVVVFDEGQQRSDAC